MKKIIRAFRIFVFCVVLVVIGIGSVRDYKTAQSRRPMERQHAVSRQVKSSHRLAFLDKDGSPSGYCTGTVIAPHAILTAEHCDENAESRTLRVDYGRRPYKILEGIVDNRDHLILLVDGPAFTDIDPVVTRAPKIGESVYSYGFGYGVYPAERSDGVVVDEYDPSEVNASAGLFYTTNPTVPGDSGAAVYGQDGAILGVVTYRIPGEFSKVETGVFQLNYRREDIDAIQTFDPVAYEAD